jgi:hypothetical protein
MTGAACLSSPKGRRYPEFARRSDFQTLGTLKPKTDGTRVGTRVHNEIVLKSVSGAVIGNGDTPGKRPGIRSAHKRERHRAAVRSSSSG